MAATDRGFQGGRRRYGRSPPAEFRRPLAAPDRGRIRRRARPGLSSRRAHFPLSARTDQTLNLSASAPTLVAEQSFAASALMFDGNLWDDHHPATLRQAKAASLTWRPSGA